MWSKVSHPPPSEIRVRSGHSSLYVDGKMLVFGGYDNTDGGACLSSLFAFDTIAHVWSEMPNANAPSGRASHCWALSPCKQKIYLWGGSGALWGRSNLGDLHAYTIAEGTWEQLTWEGAGPPPGYGATLCSYRGLLFLFGGTSGRVYNSDLYCFDVQARKWSWMQPTQAMVPAEPARVAPVAATAPNVEKSGERPFSPRSCGKNRNPRRRRRSRLGLSDLGRDEQTGVMGAMKMASADGGTGLSSPMFYCRRHSEFSGSDTDEVEDAESEQKAFEKTMSEAISESVSMSTDTDMGTDTNKMSMGMRMSSMGMGMSSMGMGMGMGIGIETSGQMSTSSGSTNYTAASAPGLSSEPSVEAADADTMAEATSSTAGVGTSTTAAAAPPTPPTPPTPSASPTSPIPPLADPAAADGFERECEVKLGESPPPCYRHQAVIQHGHMLVIGGGLFAPPPGPLQVFALHLESMQWRAVKVGVRPKMATGEEEEHEEREEFGGEFEEYKESEEGKNNTAQGYDHRDFTDYDESDDYDDSEDAYSSDYSTESSLCSSDGDSEMEFEARETVEIRPSIHNPLPLATSTVPAAAPALLSSHHHPSPTAPHVSPSSPSTHSSARPLTSEVSSSFHTNQPESEGGDGVPHGGAPCSRIAHSCVALPDEPLPADADGEALPRWAQEQERARRLHQQGQQRGRVLMWGGRDASGRRLDEFFTLHITYPNHLNVSEAEDVPAFTARMEVPRDPQKVKLPPLVLEWETMNCSVGKFHHQHKGLAEQMPSARDFHTACIREETQEMFIFGGSDGAIRMNDMYRYSTVFSPPPLIMLALHALKSVIRGQEEEGKDRLDVGCLPLELQQQLAELTPYQMQYKIETKSRRTAN